MPNLSKTSLLALIIGCLVLSTFGCRKKGPKEIEALPEGEYPATYDIVIGEGEWEAPEAVSDDDAAIYQTIYFDYDKSNIKPEFRATLEDIAADLKANRRRYVRAVGHCDERGTNEYNFGLGERRAESVRAYLAALGISPGRIRTLSKGEEEPIDPGHTEAAWARNRRVEFFIADQ